VIVEVIMEKQMEWRLAGETEFSEKTCPSATFVHHKIPHDQTRFRNRAPAVGSRRLTAWAMARPRIVVYFTLKALCAYQYLLPDCWIPHLSRFFFSDSKYDLILITLPTWSTSNVFLNWDLTKFIKINARSRHSMPDTCRTNVQRNWHSLKMIVSDNIVPQVIEFLNCALSDFYSNHKCEIAVLIMVTFRW
jgi:hypothetical protein